MLTIREAQMGIFRERSREAFKERMIAVIAEDFPESYKELGITGVVQFIEYVLRKGAENHVYSEDAVAILIELMLDFGKDFERSPDRRWAKRMLSHEILPDFVKLRAMRDRMTALTQGRRIVQTRPSAAITE